MRPILCCAALALLVCRAGAAAAAALPNEPLLPLPQDGVRDEAKIALGQRLFVDPRLSRDNRHSCVSCHDFNHGGADNRAHSVGVDGRENALNTPSVFNSAYNFRQFWNGRASSLEQQVLQVVENSNELGSNWPQVLSKLGRDAGLEAQFRHIYGTDLRPEQVADALAAYERTLTTPSRFDRYLRGDASAISGAEKQGYALFKRYGCVACHQGVNIGGNMFQVIGVMRPLPLKAQTEADLGRFQLTGRESDKHVFKVPSLRNVALTAPYFHNGSVATLDEAVDAMLTYQLGRTASAQDKALIVKFLGALSGEHLPANPAGSAK